MRKHMESSLYVPDAIRTHGLWSRSPTLYPAELRVRTMWKPFLLYRGNRTNVNRKLFFHAFILRVAGAGRGREEPWRTGLFPALVLAVDLYVRQFFILL